MNLDLALRLCADSSGERSANSGGPMSRRRTERVLATVLREGASRIRLPRVIRAGLHFGQRDPLQAVLESLARFGLDDAEQLRETFSAPAARLVVRSVPDARWGVHVDRCRDEAVLRQALLLGLCTSCVYDPARPASRRAPAAPATAAFAPRCRSA